MRFLWVEDFNDDSGDRDELQSDWMKYFNLKDVVIKETMDEALEYLEHPDHFKQFDGVLLDIRFPIIEETVYEKYFSKFVTRDLYDQYQDSGAGILLYLALVFRYNYSQERIAFVSANVDDERLEPLLVMEDKVIKSKYEKLSDLELDQYDKAEDSMARIYLEDTGKLKLELNDRIPWENGELWEPFDEQTQKDEFLARLEQIRKEMSQASQGNMSVKYNYVRKLFHQLGLIIPEAFTKPFEGCGDRSWAFYQWREELETPYYVLRRNAIEMCLILMNHMTPELIRPCKDSVGELTQILDHLCRMLPDAGFREQEYAVSFVKEIALLDEQWEKYKKFRGTKQQEGFCTVLKLARNWGVHQGIQGLTINVDDERLYGDAAFLFMIALRGYFDLTALPERQHQEYLQHEEQLLELLGPETPIPAMDELRVQLEYSFKKLLQKNLLSYKNDTTEDTDVSKIVSGIGNEKSKFKKQVSMDELYQLFWQQLYPRDQDGVQMAADDTEIVRLLRYTYWRAWEGNQYSGGRGWVRGRS